MTNKPYDIPIEREGAQESADVLLEGKVSERKRKQIDRQEEIDNAEHNTKMARLEKEKTAAEVAIEQASQKSTGSQPVFPITGGLNLGTFDLQAQQAKVENELIRLKTEAESSAQRTAEENRQLQSDLNKKELELVSATLLTQIQQSNKRIEDLMAMNANRGSIQDELERYRGIAKELGMVSPPEGGSGDLNSQIALQRLEHEFELDRRKYEDEKHDRDRKWEMEKRKWDEEKEQRKAEIEERQRTQQLWSSGFERVGAGIAQGYVDRDTSVGGSQTERGEKSPPNYQFEAGVDEEGEIDCPKCEAKIFIAQKARRVQCAKCGAVASIKRVQVQEQLAE